MTDEFKLFLAAIQNDDTNALELLLAQDEDPDVVDENDNTPLMWAAKLGRRELVRKLMSLTDLDMQNTDGDTALHLAIKYGHPDIIEILLSENKTPESTQLSTIDVDTANNEGMTPLLLAAKINDIRSVELLLESDADPDIEDNKGMTALMMAIENENADLILKLDNFVDVDLVTVTGTALHHAVKIFVTHQLKDSKIIDLLLNVLYVDVDIPDKNDITPLMLAIQLENKEMILKLAELANVNHLTRAGTALYLAAAMNNSDIVDDLLAMGADPNQYACAGNTALHLAAYRGNLDVIQSLENYGADLNIPSKTNHATALFLAALNRHPDCVHYLLQRGADPHIKFIVKKSIIMKLMEDYGPQYKKRLEKAIHMDAAKDKTTCTLTPQAMAYVLGYTDIVDLFETHKKQLREIRSKSNYDARIFNNPDDLAAESRQHDKKPIIKNSRTPGRN